MNGGAGAARSSLATLAAVLAFGCLAALIAHRALAILVVDGEPRLDNAGLTDFRDAAYYPAVAFLNGDNPYDYRAYAARYPIGALFPLYSPLALALYTPFALVGFATAARAFLLVNVALVPILAWTALRVAGARVSPTRVFVLATVILASRPGYVNLVVGQCTLVMVIATYLAWHYAPRRPLVAGAALALATMKPTFGGPLALLLLARGSLRTVVAGGVLAVTAALVPTAVLVHQAGGVTPILASFASNQSDFDANPHVDPSQSLVRPDVPGLAARLVEPLRGSVPELAVGFAILALGMLALARTRPDGGDAGHRQLALAAACLTILACIYHQDYDALLLVAPLVALLDGALDRARIGSTAAWAALVGLVALPSVNYLTAPALLDRIGLDPSLPPGGGGVLLGLIASLNALAVLAAWLLVLGLLVRRAPAPGSAS